MNQSNNQEPATRGLEGPVVPGSPLHRLLEQVAGAVAKKLLAGGEAKKENFAPNVATASKAGRD